MSVELEPAELGFRRPFTHEVSQVLRLHNPNSDPVAFKVKTTAPKQYCVRPNSGRIEAGRDVEVQVLLQAMKEDPPPDARCRDKFLVQSVAITPDKESLGNVTQIWTNLEQTAKKSIDEKKIRVNFLPADGSAGVAGAATNGVGGGQEEEQPPAYSSPSPMAVTPQRQMRDTASAPGLGTPASNPADTKNIGSSLDNTSTPATQQQAQPQSTLGAAAAAVSSVIPMSGADLQKQLDAANQRIKQLQEQASEGLRQRKVTGEGEKSTASSGMSMQNAPSPGGVPVQIVAGLCLLCFLIAYIFF